MKNEKKDTGVYTFLNREPQLTGDVIEYGSWIEVSEDGRTPIDSQRLAEFIILTQPWIVINGCIYEYDNGVYRLLPSNEVKDRIIEMLMGKGIWPTQLEYVMDLIKKDDRMVVSPDLVDCKSNLLNIKNGLYDLETKKLYAHSPEYISTQKHKIVYEVNNFEERLTDQPVFSIIKQDEYDLVKELCSNHIQLSTHDNEVLKATNECTSTEMKSAEHE